jgi:hypothetical protein
MGPLADSLSGGTSNMATVANEKTSLLRQLRIDRGPPPAAKILRLWWKITLGASLFAAGAVARHFTRSAYEDAKPIFERNEKEDSAGLISAQRFDQARTQFDAAKSELLLAQSALVRIAIDQKDPRILPDMGAHVRFLSAARIGI